MIMLKNYISYTIKYIFLHIQSYLFETIRLVQQSHQQQKLALLKTNLFNKLHQNQIFNNLHFLEIVEKKYNNSKNMKNYQNMNVVHTTKDGHELWLGDYYAATDHRLLKSKNITCVLTAAAQLGVKYPPNLNIVHKTINAYDIPTYKMTPHFQEAYQFIKAGLERGNILVHCAAGISRSATFVLVYLMREEGTPLKQALLSVRQKRHVVNPNYGFQAELAKFQDMLKKGLVSGAQKADKEQKQQKDQIRLSGAFTQKPDKTVEDIQAEKEAFNKFISKETYNPRDTLNRAKDTHYNRMKSMGAKNLSNGDARKTSNFEAKRGPSVDYRRSAYDNSRNHPITRIQDLTFKLEQPKIVSYKR